MPNASHPEPAPGAGLSLSSERTLLCEGAWTLDHIPALERELARVRPPPADGLVCDAGGILAMDASGAVLLQRALEHLGRRGASVRLVGLRPELQALLQLVAVRRREAEAAPARRPGPVERLGRGVYTRAGTILPAAGFVGAVAAALLAPWRKPSRIRVRPLLAAVQTDGFGALPIVGLLSFLMGVVIAYQAAVQLRAFGADIFIVDLSGISMLREIAPVITAVLVAGRSGSAYAAQIGSMSVTEELDAVRSLGVSPLELLVVPRLLGLLIAVPLLTVYADIVGVFGSMIIAAGQLQVTFLQFLTRMRETVSVDHLLFGLVKTPVFALIIGMVGCYQGLRVRGGVDAVGRHTTISVVQAVFWVIVFDALASVVMSSVGF